VALTLVDLVVLLGVSVVLPLALPNRWRWAAATVGVLLALQSDVGTMAAAFTLPWMGAAIWAGWPHLRTLTRTPRTLADAASLLAAAYALVAAVAFASSRLGYSLFGVGEPVVELTAVHYTYAGTAALVLASQFLGSITGRWRRVAQVATGATAVAPVIVALGFVTHRAIPQVGGAVLMTIGVWLTATLELHTAIDPDQPAAVRILSAISGVAIWIPMVLAVAWASGQHWDVPALSIPDMERTHGLANALAFVLCGLVAARLPTWRDGAARPVSVRSRGR
jgi:hypothetical protein